MAPWFAPMLDDCAPETSFCCVVVCVLENGAAEHVGALQHHAEIRLQPVQAPLAVVDAVDEDPATSATGAGVGACQACTNAAAAASCPGVCATGRIFAAAGVEPPITVTRLFAARASPTTTFAARRSPPRRTIPMRAGGAAAVPQRRAMAFGNIPTRRCRRTPNERAGQIDLQ